MARKKKKGMLGEANQALASTAGTIGTTARAVEIGADVMLSNLNEMLVEAKVELAITQQEGIKTLTEAGFTPAQAMEIVTIDTHC